MKKIEKLELELKSNFIGVYYDRLELKLNEVIDAVNELQEFVGKHEHVPEWGNGPYVVPAKKESKASFEDKLYVLFHNFAHDLADGQNHLYISNLYAQTGAKLAEEHFGKEKK